MLQWEVSGDVVSCFLTDSIHCSWCSSPSPGEPNRDQWGSQMNQCYSFVQVCTALPVMWPLQKHLENLLVILVCNKGNVGFVLWPCLHLVWVGPVYGNNTSLRQCVIFLWFNGLYMHVPFSICLTKLTSITGILCIPLQRHKAGDAEKRCANVWLLGPASPECSLSLGQGVSCLN